MWLNLPFTDPATPLARQFFFGRKGIELTTKPAIPSQEHVHVSAYKMNFFSDWSQNQKSENHLV